MFLYSRKSLAVFSFVALTVICGLGLFLYSAPVPAAPKVTWMPPSITSTIGAGKDDTVQASFTASKDLRNIHVRVVPELESFVSVEPSTFDHIRKGATTTVAVTFSSSILDEEETYNGVIQLRQGKGGKGNVARPLPTTLTIQKPDMPSDVQELNNWEGGYSVLIPSDWEVGTGGTTNPAYRALRPAGKEKDIESGYVADITIATYPNTENLDFVDFFNNPQTPGWVNYFKSSKHQTYFDINGLEAVLFEHVYGMHINNIIAVKLDGRIVKFTAIDQSHTTDGLFYNIATSLVPLF